MMYGAIGPDTPPDSPVHQTATMAGAAQVNNENAAPAGPPNIKVFNETGTPRKYREAPVYIQPEAEKFPSFLPAPKPIAKSKSLTSAEIQSELISSTQVAAIASALQSEAPPLSLEQARQRRESIKDERKKSIDFIRRRTMSRASAIGRPTLSALEVLKEPRFGEVVDENRDRNGDGQGGKGGR